MYSDLAESNFSGTEAGSRSWGVNWKWENGERVRKLQFLETWLWREKKRGQKLEGEYKVKEELFISY